MSRAELRHAHLKLRMDARSVRFQHERQRKQHVSNVIDVAPLTWLRQLNRAAKAA